MVESFTGTATKKPCTDKKPYLYEYTPSYNDLKLINKYANQDKYRSDDLGGPYKATEDASE